MPQASIIGAGPAGSVAAICLVRAGWEVDLYEQHRFPRDKVCGECLSPLALAVLEEIGLGRAIGELCGPVFGRVVLVHLTGDQVSIALPKPMRGVSRAALDLALLDAARASGARVHQPARVERIDHASRALWQRSLQDNRCGAQKWDYLLVGNGKAAISSAALKHLFSPPPGTPGEVRGEGFRATQRCRIRTCRRARARTRDFGVKAHFAGVADEPDAISLFGLHGHYCGLARIEGSLWNLAMSVPAARLRACEVNLDRLYEELLNENRGLSNRMECANRVSAWQVSPLPRFAVSGGWPDRVVPIGNAAAALEPIGGEGIGLAMRSAQLAAETLIRAEHGGTELDARALIQSYRKLWNIRRVICRTGAQIISNPPLSQLAVALLARWNICGSIFLNLTGKRACL